MQSDLPRPFRPIELGAKTLAFFCAPSLAGGLKSHEEYERSGIAAVTLARDDPFTLVLVALRKGRVMREHRAPSAGTVVLFSGRAKFVGGDGEGTDLEPGSFAVFSADVRHAVEALEDAVYLVVIGGRHRGHPVAHEASK